jgi:hypothetical protein
MRTAPPKRDKPRTTKSQTRRARGLVGAAQHFWRQDHHLQELAPEYSAHLTDQSVEQVARGEDSLSTPQSRRDAGRRWRAAPDEGLSQRHLFAWPSPRPYPQAGRVTTPRSETSMELHRREFSALPEREYAYGRRRACRRRKSEPSPRRSTTNRASAPIPTARPSTRHPALFVGSGSRGVRLVVYFVSIIRSVSVANFSLSALRIASSLVNCSMVSALGQASVIDSLSISISSC